MNYVVIQGKKINLSEAGFLLEFNSWSDEVFKYFCDQDSIKIERDHWIVVKFLREHYRKYQDFPTIRKICTETKLNVPVLQRLFGQTYLLNMCRLSGLPRPQQGCLS